MMPWEDHSALEVLDQMNLIVLVLSYSSILKCTESNLSTLSSQDDVIYKAVLMLSREILCEWKKELNFYIREMSCTQEL